VRSSDATSASGAGEERRDELVRALFEEIMQRVGDMEKEFAMRWWEDNRAALEGERLRREDGEAGGKVDKEGKSKGKGRAEGGPIASRL